MLVHNGSSGGEKTAIIVEPRVVMAESGKVLLDLWQSYQNYELHFVSNTGAEIIAYNTHNGKTRRATIDFAREVFTFNDNPNVSHPLASLPAMISMH